MAYGGRTSRKETASLLSSRASVMLPLGSKISLNSDVPSEAVRLTENEAVVPSPLGSIGSKSSNLYLERTTLSFIRTASTSSSAASVPTFSKRAETV